MPREFEGRAKPAISPSECESALMCSHRAYLEYHTGKRWSSLAMARGSAVHRGAQLDAESKIQAGVPLPPRAVVDRAVASYEARVSGEVGDPIWLYPKDVAKGRSRAVGEEKDRTARLARLYARDVSPDIVPDFSERRLFADLPGHPFDLSGQIDQARRPARGRMVANVMVPEAMLRARDMACDEADLLPIPGSGDIYDFKTRARKRADGEVHGSTQFSMYAALYRHAIGVLPGRIHVIDLCDYASGEPAVHCNITTRDQGAITALVNRLSAYAELMRAGITIPAPDNAWWCGPNSCAFWQECPFVNSDKRQAAERRDDGAS